MCIKHIKTSANKARVKEHLRCQGRNAPDSRRKEGGRKEGRKERRKEGRKEGMTTEAP